MSQNISDIYVELINSRNGEKEAVMCTKCKQVFQTVGPNTLNAHSLFCSTSTTSQTLHDGLSNSESFSCTIDLDGNKNPDLIEPPTTENLDDLLTKMFVACNIPFRAVENIHFKNFVNALQNSTTLYKPPCRQTLSSTCIYRLHDEIKKERFRLLNNTSSVVLVDGWKNKSNNKKFLVFSLRNVNIQHTYLTFVDHTLQSEDGESLAEAISNAITFAKEEFNTDVFAIVTDNDSKIVCGGRLADSSENTHLWQSTCNSHSGNLFLKNLVDPSFAETVRQVVSVYRESKLQALLISQGGSKLQNYPDTRFCYFRDTCQSILKNIEKMQKVAMIEDMNIDENVFNIIFDENFIIKLSETIETLNSICKLINACQNPISNVADAVEMWIALRSSKKFDEVLINSRIKKAIWPVGYAAHILHPKYQGVSLSEEEEKIAYDFFKDNLDSVTLQELDRFINEREEIIQKLMDKSKDPIAFWRLCEPFYPHLHKVGIKISLIPASTASLESLFSNWAFVHNTHRNRLINIKSSALVDIYYSLRHFHFNNANTQIDNE